MTTLIDQRPAALARRALRPQDLAHVIEMLGRIARQDFDPGDVTQGELIDALDVALAAAARLRLERSEAFMRQVNEH